MAKNELSIFESVLNEAERGDLAAKVDLSEIGEEYRTLGEQINSTIESMKERENEIREKVDYLDNLVTFVGALDIDGTLTFMNKKPAEALGAKKEDFIGKKLWEAEWFSYNKDVAERIRESIEGATSGESSEFEIDLMSAEGLLPVKFTADPLRDKNGEIYTVLVTGTPIVEQKEKEEELEDRNRFVTEVIESIPDPLAIIDREKRWIEVNDAWKRVLGYEKGDLLGKEMAELPIITEELRKTMGKISEENIEKARRGDAIKLEATLRAKDGREVPMLIVEGALSSIDGRIMIAKDITELKEREINLEGAISIFGSVLSKAAGGDLSDSVELDLIDEDYRPIGEDINSMIEGTKEREEELREKEKKIEGEKAFSDQIINAVMDPLCVVDNEGTWQRANPAWERLVGYKPEELLGKKNRRTAVHGACDGYSQRKSVEALI